MTISAEAQTVVRTRRPPGNALAHADGLNKSPVWAVLAASFVGTATNFAVHLINLRMQSLGVDASTISISVAFQAAAICITAWILRSNGSSDNLRFATLASVVASTLLLPVISFVSDPLIFILMRVALGVCLTASVVAAEYVVTWQASETKNSQLIAWFTASLGIGGLLGPLLISWTGVTEVTSFLVAASLFLVGGALLLISFPHHAGHSLSKGQLTRIISFMPTACATALVFGAVDSAGISLLPIYGSLHGLTLSSAANLAVAAALGAITLQFPICWASTQWHPRHVLVGICVLAIATAALMPAAIGISFAAHSVSFVLGGLVEGLFTVTLIWISRDRRKNSIAQINASMVATASLGEIIGPAASSIALDYAGANGIVIVMIAAFTLLVLPLTVVALRMSASSMANSAVRDSEKTEIASTVT